MGNRRTARYAVVAQEGDDFVFAHGHRSQVGEYLFAEEAAYEVLVERLYVAALVEYDVVLLQCGQNLFLIDADTFFQLAVDFLIDFFYQFGCRLFAFFVA